MAAPDYSPAALAAAAGVDPWALARQVTDGRPDVVRAIGQAYQARATQAADVVGLGRKADELTGTAFTNDRAAVFDAQASGVQSRQLLSEGGEKLAEIGRVFTTVGEGLSTAANTVTGHLTTLQADVNDVIARRNAFMEGSGRMLAPEDRDAAERGFLFEATRLTGRAAGRVQTELDDYDRLVRSRTGYFQEFGYDIRSEPPAPPDEGSGAADTLAVLKGGGTLLLDLAGSVGNAALHHPVEVLGLAVGASLAAVSAAGVAAGAAATATGVGAPGGLPLAGASAEGVVAGLGIAGLAGMSLLDYARGEDRVDTSVEAGADGPDVDRNGTWRGTVAAHPDPPGIAHDGASRAHIPWGEPATPDRPGGGGHIHDSGVPNKTTFPEDWTADRLLDAIEDVARNPDQAPVQDRDGSWLVEGIRDGVEIKVRVGDDGIIRTGYPVRGPGVHRNDANGDPQPLEN